MANKVGYHNLVIDIATGIGTQATITVYDAGTVNLSTIYSDVGGTAESNPFTTDAYGRFSFFADPAEYDIKVSGAGITAYTLEDVSIIGVGEKVFCIGLFEAGVSVIVVNGAVAYTIPAAMNGMNLVDVIASVHTKGITATTDIQVRRRRAGADADMLSDKITIGDEYFATDETVDGNNDDVITGDSIFIDVDAIHSGTAPLGLSVTLTFRLS